MTTCMVHADEPAVSTCGACGAEMCAGCERRIHGTPWCEECLASRLTGVSPPARPLPVSGAPMRVKSPGVALVLGLLVPGLGTVYCFNGPARRALVQFASWALLLWSFRQSSGMLAVVLFFGWVGFYLWQAIDAHSCARAFNALGRVPTEQEAEDMGRGPYLFHGADSRSLGTALLVVGVVMLVFEAAGALLHGLRWAWPLALVAMGVAIALRARAARRRRDAGATA